MTPEPHEPEPHPPDPTRHPDDPTPTRILWEIVLYTALVLAVGVAFVAVRVAREGPRVLDVNPRAGDGR